MLQVLGATNSGAAARVGQDLKQFDCQAGHCWPELTVDTIVGGRVADNRVPAAKGEVILAVDLVLATIDTVGASPDVNVRLTVVPVRG